MSNQSKSEYIEEIIIRYKKSSKEEKKKILDEFCNVCRYNRKYAIRKLNIYSKDIPVKERKRAGRKKKYHSKAIKDFIKTLRVKTDLICSKMLKAAIPLWLPLYKENVHLSKKDEALIRMISPPTIDPEIRRYVIIRSLLASEFILNNFFDNIARGKSSLPVCLFTPILCSQNSLQ